MSDLLTLSIEELVYKIKDAQITSEELCKEYIERINKFEKDVRAWAHFDEKLLIEKAIESDNHRRSGKVTGPLHGIPIALKDIIGTLDMPTECGTVIRKGKSYSQNAEIIDLLLSAGAIIMGKTATSELAYLGPSNTTNPFSAIANCIIVGSPTMATSILGRLGSRLFKPFSPELSSSAVAAIIRLYFRFGES